MQERIIEFCASQDGSVEKNLRSRGVSSSICVQLRKRMGRISVFRQGAWLDIRIIDKLSNGENFRIIFEDTDIKPLEKYNVEIKIVYEDEDVAVIDKPSGIAVIPTHRHYGLSLANALANVWGDFVYRPVNRLDLDTTGLMLVAKNQYAHSQLSKQKMERKYLALCQGSPSGKYIASPVGLESENGAKRCVRDDGKMAITHYMSLKTYGEYSLVLLQLETGRTHQIRIHMASIGNPLCCDKLYNDNAKAIVCPNGKALDRQALHSCFISFIQPVSGERIELCSCPEFVDTKDFEQINVAKKQFDINN